MNKLFLIPHKHLAIHATQHPTGIHARTRIHTLCNKKEAGIVSKPIITIHTKDDLPRPSPSSPLWRRSGLGAPPPVADEIPRTEGGGVPRDLMCCYICCPCAREYARTHGKIAVGISLKPLLCLILSACETAAASPGARQAL